MSIDPSCCLGRQFRDELGIAAQIFQRKRSPSRAGFELSSRGKHPGAGPTCFRPHSAGIEQGHTQTRLRQTPRDRTANDSRARNHRIQGH
jgi:hypothetical protein